MKRGQKRITSLAVVIFMIIALIPVGASAAANTWDPDHGVYDISTEDDLFAFKDSLDNANYYEGIEVRLMDDIAVTEGRTYVSPDSNGTAEAQFCGTFNGNGHTISNLNMVSSDGYTVSFLPFLGNATIKDLTLKDVKILEGKTWNAAFAPVSLGDDYIINCHLEGDCTITVDPSFSRAWNYTAGLVADNYMGTLTIEDCSVGAGVTINGTGSSSFTGRKAAGFVAYMRQGATNLTIKDSLNYATVTSDETAAGFVGTVASTSGYENQVDITGCRNYGNISTNPGITGATESSAGIISGGFQCTTINIDRCFNYGDITVYGDSATDSGGIAGEISMGSVTNCYNSGTVRADKASCLGGIVGHFRTDGVSSYPDQYNSLINCYNEGAVIGGDTPYTGGVIGFVQDETRTVNHSLVKNCYSFGAVSGNGSVGSVTGGLQDTHLENCFALMGTHAVGEDVSMVIPDMSVITSHVGYYDSPDKGGKVYPAVIESNAGSYTETISSTPLGTDLRETLHQFAIDENAALAADGKAFRYYPWIVSESSDPHAVFGYNVFVLTPAEESSINGGFVVTSRSSLGIDEFLDGAENVVEITSTPEALHSIAGISVVDANGVVIPVTEVSEGVYRFVMPEVDVNVRAIYSIDYITSINVTKTYIGDAGYASAGSVVAPAGVLAEDVTFAVAPFNSFNRELGKTAIPAFASASYVIHAGSGTDNVEIALPDFSGSDYGIGDYWYTVTENAGSTAGVGYDGSTYYLHVVVTNENPLDPTSVGVSQVTLHKEAPAADGSYVNTAADKTTGFANSYASGSLKVKKELSGNMADMNKTFEVTVTFTAPAGKTVTGPISYGTLKIEGPWTDTRSVTLTLGNSDEVTFTNIPSGVTYTVKESDYTADGYAIPVYSFDNASEAGDTVEDDSTWAGTYASGTIGDDADTVTVSNEKNAVIDVGVIVEKAPFIILLVLTLATAIVVFRRRRLAGEDD